MALYVSRGGIQSERLRREFVMKKNNWKIVTTLVALLVVSAFVVASDGLPDFSLAASPSARTITWLEIAQYHVGLTRLNGFSGTVQLSCQPSSPYISCVVRPSIVPLVGEGSDIPVPEILMLVTAKPGAPAGRYSIRITGTALVGGEARANHTTVVLELQPLVDSPSE